VSASTVIGSAYGVLRAHGYSSIAAAGVIGNAYQESTLKPDAEADGGGGLWGFTANPQSLADLKAYAAKAGKPWTDVELQTQFLVEHIPASIVAGLNKQSTPQAAAAYFMTAWEKPAAATANQAKREEGATIAYNMIKGGGESLISTAAKFLTGGLETVVGIQSGNASLLSKGVSGVAASDSKVASAAAGGFLQTSAGELVLKGVLLLAGAILVIYGIMVAVRPPDRALSVPKVPAMLPVPV
jgi:Phage tail lysozyme